MKQMGERLRTLRQNAGLSQAKMAKILGASQAGVNRYEHGEATPSVETLRKYSDYFDVSMDYIYGQTDHPQGKLYGNKPQMDKLYPEMERFIEMCFEPGSPMNERLKDSLRYMMKEDAV